MKKLIIVLILVLGLVPMAWSFNISGEEISPAATSVSSSSASADEMKLEVVKITKIVKGSDRAAAARHKELKKENGEIRGAVVSLAKSQGEVIEKVAHSSWITWGAIALAVILIIGVGVFFYRRIQRDARGFFPRLWNTMGDNLQVATDTYRSAEITRNTSAEALELMRVVNTKLGTIETKIDEVPEKTAALVKALDPADFVFEVENHVVTYKSPAEGITEGYYLRIYVPKDMAGDPATYSRDIESSRGAVNRELKKIMAKFFRGEFDAPEFALQKALIQYLRANGELTWRTV